MVKKEEIRSNFGFVFLLEARLSLVFLDPMHLVLNLTILDIDLVNLGVDLVDLGVDMVDLGVFC